MRWHLFCLKMRYLFREPYDVEANRALAAEIERLRKLCGSGELIEKEKTCTRD